VICSEEHGSITARSDLLCSSWHSVVLRFVLPYSGSLSLICTPPRWRRFGHSDRSDVAFGEEHSSITASSVTSIPPRWRWRLEEHSSIEASFNAFVSRPNHGAQVSYAVWRSGCCSLMSWQPAVMPAHLHHSALGKEVNRLSVSDPPVGILNSSASLSNP
jgi:hypothetical protein